MHLPVLSCYFGLAKDIGFAQMGLGISFMNFIKYRLVIRVVWIVANLASSLFLQAMHNSQKGKNLLRSRAVHFASFGRQPLCGFGIFVVSSGLFETLQQMELVQVASQEEVVSLSDEEVVSLSTKTSRSGTTSGGWEILSHEGCGGICPVASDMTEESAGSAFSFLSEENGNNEVEPSPFVSKDEDLALCQLGIPFTQQENITPLTLSLIEQLITQLQRKMDTLDRAAFGCYLRIFAEVLAFKMLSIFAKLFAQEKEAVNGDPAVFASLKVVFFDCLSAVFMLLEKACLSFTYDQVVGVFGKKNFNIAWPRLIEIFKSRSQAFLSMMKGEAESLHLFNPGLLENHFSVLCNYEEAWQIFLASLSDSTKEHLLVLQKYSSETS